MNNQMTNQTQTTEQPTVEVQPIAIQSAAELMKIATISDQTRSYLILIGKLQDLYGEASNVAERDYSDRQVDMILSEYYDSLSKARSEIESLLIYSINDNMGRLNSNQI